MAEANKAKRRGKAPKSNKTRPSAAYQELKDELESILADLQRDDLDVDQALKRYERGLELVGELESYLTTAENTVRELKAKFNQTAG